MKAAQSDHSQVEMTEASHKNGTKSALPPTDSLIPVEAETCEIGCQGSDHEMTEAPHRNGSIPPDMISALPPSEPLIPVGAETCEITATLPEGSDHEIVVIASENCNPIMKAVLLEGDTQEIANTPAQVILNEMMATPAETVLYDDGEQGMTYLLPRHGSDKSVMLYTLSSETGREQDLYTSPSTSESIIPLMGYVLKPETQPMPHTSSEFVNHQIQSTEIVNQQLSSAEVKKEQIILTETSDFIIPSAESTKNQVIQSMTLNDKVSLSGSVKLQMSSSEAKLDEYEDEDWFSDSGDDSDYVMDSKYLPRYDITKTGKGRKDNNIE